MDKLVNPSSVSVLGPPTSDDHMESMDMSDSLEVQFKKFNELFTSRFTRLESLIAKVSSQEISGILVGFSPSPLSSALFGGLHWRDYKILVQQHWLAWILLFRVHKSPPYYNWFRCIVQPV